MFFRMRRKSRRARRGTKKRLMKRTHPVQLTKNIDSITRLSNKYYKSIVRCEEALKRHNDAFADHQAAAKRYNVASIEYDAAGVEFDEAAKAYDAEHEAYVQVAAAYYVDIETATKCAMATQESDKDYADLAMRYHDASVRCDAADKRRELVAAKFSEASMRYDDAGIEYDMVARRFVRIVKKYNETKRKYKEVRILYRDVFAK